MGSRLKPDPEHTFHWFFEATCPVARDKDPGLSFQFPEDFGDEEACHALPRFCFPFDIQRVRDVAAVQHFTFVLTDLQGCQRFGFCRLTGSTRTCLCILSYLPWFEVFYKLLNNLADFLSKGQTGEVKSLLAALYRQPLPLATGSVTLQMVPYFIAPDPQSLPSIPENRNLTELIVAVDVGNLLHLYASMLFERRILIFSSKLSTLTSCVHALSATLYPMYWQHIFIPVLPPHLLDYCCAPTPYLIGVHSSLSEWVRSRDLEDVVILDVDSNTLETPFSDCRRIPPDVMSGLKACLKRQAVSRGRGVSGAFLKAQALLFGGYRHALQTLQGEVRFSEEIFLDHKSSRMKLFLQSAVHLQCFKQFVDSRLDVLNSGKKPQDLFEEEILKSEAAEGRSKSYQQVVGHLKKGGGALILNMKSKASVGAKTFTKSGLKKLLHHKQEGSVEPGQQGAGQQEAGQQGAGQQGAGSPSHRRVRSDCLQDRLPITQHYGKPRPRRPLNQSRCPRDDGKDGGEPGDGAGPGPPAEPRSTPQGDEEECESALFSDAEEMDLLGEIFDSLGARSPYERGVLYGTRSLDLFGPDSHDYITKRGTASPSQESLALSVSGSLHSWNVETMEELSDPTEDSDWLSPDGGEPLEETDDKEEEEEEERGPGQKSWDDANGRQEPDQSHQVQGVKLEAGEQGGGPEEEPSDRAMEDERLKGQQGRRLHRGEDVQRKTADGQKQAAGQDGTETEEEQRGRPETERTTCPEPRASEEESERRHPPPPKVQSARARFQTAGPSRGVPITSRIEALEPRGGPEAGPEAGQSAAPPEEDGRPPVKVSELKKRFEA